MHVDKKEELNHSGVKINIQNTNNIGKVKNSKEKYAQMLTCGER